MITPSCLSCNLVALNSDKFYLRNVGSFHETYTHQRENFGLWRNSSASLMGGVGLLGASPSRPVADNGGIPVPTSNRIVAAASKPPIHAIEHWGNVGRTLDYHILFAKIVPLGHPT